MHEYHQQICSRFLQIVGVYLITYDFYSSSPHERM